MLSRRLTRYLYAVIGALAVGSALLGVLLLGPDQQAAARFDAARACGAEGAGCLVDKPGTLIGHRKREVQRSKPAYTARFAETVAPHRQSTELLHFTFPAFDRLTDGEPVTLRFYDGQLTDVFANGDHFRTDHNPDVNFEADYGLIWAASAVGAFLLTVIGALLLLDRRRRPRARFGGNDSATG